MELIFRRSKHFLHSIVATNENESQTPVSSLKVLHQPLIVRNVSIANRIQNIHRIKVPSKCSTTLKLLQDNFSTIDVDEYEDDEGDDVEVMLSNLMTTIHLIPSMIIIVLLLVVITYQSKRIWII